MTCPRCYSEFRKGPDACPECGVRLSRAVTGMMKTSAVMITAGGEPEFYSSVQDVPEPLRTQLLEVTSSSNSGTIVIADQAGKDQITQAMARRGQTRERSPRSRLPLEPRRSRIQWIAWTGAAAVLAAAGALAALFFTH